MTSGLYFLSWHLWILFMFLKSVPLLILLFSYKCFDFLCVSFWVFELYGYSCCSVYLRHSFYSLQSFQFFVSHFVNTWWLSCTVYGYFLFTLNVNFLLCLLAIFFVPLTSSVIVFTLSSFIISVLVFSYCATFKLWFIYSSLCCLHLCSSAWIFSIGLTKAEFSYYVGPVSWFWFICAW